ncbi:MAG: anti-sigma factor family protein [Planctomycetaceae bacterium]
MNCKQAEQLLALWVGGDLDEASGRELEEHLALCSTCRATGRRLKASQQVLVHAGHAEPLRLAKSETVPASASADSVWPNVARGLRALEARKRKQRFNGWIPAAAVLAAALAILISPYTNTSNTPSSPTIAPSPAGWGQSGLQGGGIQGGMSGTNPIPGAGQFFTDFDQPLSGSKNQPGKDHAKSSKPIDHPFFRQFKSLDDR